MTFVATITALSERFLTERSFELIVAPALADFEYDVEVRGEAAARMAVLAAMAGACWDDAIRGGHLATFAGLAFIPLCYYTFWFLVWIPQGVQSIGGGVMTIVTLLMIVLSLAPAVVCYWPGARPGGTSAEHE